LNGSSEPSTAPRSRRDSLALALVFALLTVAFADVIFSGSGWFQRDLTSFYYPTKSLIRATILSGELPLWNRAYGAGQPMAANPEYEIFYPPQLLILIGPYDFGFRLHILFHLFLAAFGMFVLLRSLELRSPAAAFGAISFVLGGLTASSICLLTTLFPLSWMPLLLWATRQTFRLRSAPHCAGAALCLGMIGLVGEPAALIESLLIVLAYAGYSLARADNSARKTIVISAIAVVTLGLGVAMVQLLPASDFVRDTVRSRGFASEMARYWSLPPLRPLEFFFPNFFGALKGGAGLMRMNDIYPTEGNPYYFCLYPGLLVSILFLTAVSLRLRGAAVMLGVVGASIVAALGSHSPLFPLFRMLPILSSLRFHEKFVVIAALVLPIQAAIAFDALLAAEDGARVRIRALLVSAVVGLSAAILAVLLGSSHPGAVGGFVRTTLVAAACAGAFVLLRSRHRFGAVVLIVIAIADLLPLFGVIAPRQPRRFFTEMPSAARALSQDHYRVFHEADWHQTSPTGRRYFSGDAADNLWRWKNGLFPMTGARWGVQSVFDVDIDQTLLLGSTDLLETLLACKRRNDALGEARILNMSNVRWRAFYRPYGLDLIESGGDAERSQPVIFVPRATNPRYYFADQIIGSRSAAEFARDLQRGTDRTAFLDTPGAVLAPGIIKQVRESSHSARLTVNVPAGTAYLIASVSAHRYWKAFIDGVPARIYTTNVAYQGIYITKGHHEVIFRYSNPFVQIGALVSAVSAGLILVVGLAGRERRLTPQANVRV